MCVSRTLQSVSCLAPWKYSCSFKKNSPLGGHPGSVVLFLDLLFMLRKIVEVPVHLFKFYLFFLPFAPYQIYIMALMLKCLETPVLRDCIKVYAVPVGGAGHTK